MIYWTIVTDNYCDEYHKYYFENYELAKKSFDALVNQHRNKAEFEANENHASWFDPHYNEYSTYVRLVKTEIVINNKVIDNWF